MDRSLQAMGADQRASYEARIVSLTDRLKSLKEEQAQLVRAPHATGPLRGQFVRNRQEHGTVGPMLAAPAEGLLRPSVLTAAVRTCSPFCLAERADGDADEVCTGAAG